ncbi:hypothetical protein HELRODRAFT_150486, partial [Helobdella robusta]|uniref:Mitogen-activated protein kinase n=1 Tax=Helobdella robusta TaxID=6412 RepID=T1EKF8_HELRO
FELQDTDYVPNENIGSGAYGVVWSATNKLTNQTVAIKKISDIFIQPTIAVRTYREIKILRHFKHENIISIRDIICQRSKSGRIQDVYIVFDLMESDLHKIIYSRQILTEEHVKYFLYQIACGLMFIHSANVIHRDLKPSNLLVNENCTLKIGDFGHNGCISGRNNKLTHYVATRWYRAPELLLQFPSYSYSVDLWSVGCILAELIYRKTLFAGKDMMNQLELIFTCIHLKTKNFHLLAPAEKVKLFLKKTPTTTAATTTTTNSVATPQSLALIEKLLQLDSAKRMTCEELVNDPYFSSYHHEN